LEQFHIHGVVPVIPTPFRADETIDFASLQALIDFAVAANCSAICLPAYASEFYKLSDEERLAVAREAVVAARRGIPVIGQANHAAARLAAKSARDLQAAGVDAVAVAVPRLFSLPEPDIFRYFDTVLSAIEVPLLVQDFNPGGPTLSPRFIADLHRLHAHFRYIKLEEPLMAAKIKAILDATAGEVGVLEGWGGMYLLELIEAGICGVMPGLALADLLSRIYRLSAAGNQPAAYDIFSAVLPQIVFSLQNMEFFHHAEKRLLALRGILPGATVRDLTISPHPIDAAHIDFLNRQILALLDRLHMPRNPLSRDREGALHR